MMTINELEMIQDEELKALLIKFNYLHRLDDKNFYKISPDDNSYVAQIIRNDLAIFIYKRLVNQKFLYAISIPNHLKYLKKKELSDSLLLDNCNLDYWKINDIAWMPSGSCPTESLVDFISSQNIYKDINLLNIIKSFVTDSSNKHIIRPSKSIYLPLAEEKRRLKEVLIYKDNGYKVAPKELNDYINTEYRSLGARCIQLSTDDDVRNWALKEINNYQNKRIGNIGEYFFQMILEGQGLFPYHVSKECGDGFGYDHLCPYMEYEDLYETKSTLSNSESDVITISENEYNTMLDCLGLERSNYYISRMFIDRETLRQSNSLLLKPFDDKLLVPYYDGPIYKYDHDQGCSKVFIKQ